jgi:hypothetical protein
MKKTVMFANKNIPNKTQKETEKQLSKQHINGD